MSTQNRLLPPPILSFSHFTTHILNILSPFLYDRRKNVIILFKYNRRHAQGQPRALKEELGIETDLFLKEIDLYQDQWQSEWHYLYYGFHDNPYPFDPHEVAAVKAFDCQKSLDHCYDADFPIMAHVFEQLEILRPVWNTPPLS